MASQNRFLKFMASAKGRRFTFFGTCGASLTAFGVQYFPHTFLLFKHRELVASYREGAERPVSATLQERFNIAADYLKVVDFDKKFLKPFMVSGFDLYHIGSTKFRFGSLVGIPINYTYSSSEDIDKADMIVRGQPINWELAGGKLLEEALVLTEDEQIFGLARELLQLQDNRVLVNSLIASGSIVLYYCTTSFLNSKLMFFYKPLSLRVFLYNFVGAFVIGIYAFFSDFLAVNRDGETDERLASLGENFIAAGIRFYDKLLKKNMACRDLTGDLTEYTATGNENFMLRYQRLPLTIRKSYFEKRLQELNQAKEGATEEAEASSQ